VHIFSLLAYYYYFFNASMWNLMQTWQNHLSEDERNFLKQFLPTGLGTEEVVEALLAGDNFHFGNPLLRW
jgi:hypothetical protein